MVKLGILGVGNMGSALLKGMLRVSVIPASQIYIYDNYADTMHKLSAELEVHCTKSAVELVEACDMVLLAVKPNVCKAILQECANALSGKALISIVTGWCRVDFESIARDMRVLCVMPNTPALVGEGMSVLNMDHTLFEEEYVLAKQLLAGAGSVAEVPANLMEAVTGVSGSGPAYVYLFIEALADGGVREGLPRALAYQLAAQTVLGAAKMVLETKQHPGALKDAVCSPGGTTIEAVIALERAGLRAAVMDAVEVCTDKARLMRDNKA